MGYPHTIEVPGHAGHRAAQMMFPRLSAEQIARLDAVGQRRRVDRGEVIVEQGIVAPAFLSSSPASSRWSIRRMVERCR